ncbi:hypothetical protein Y032_0265g661 [Ancylostoma ceylanicum]|uniref:Uncharacterized protein n=1 Tax=Ancylostoma ceylanicum TaxID=53326 RepID=A0A016SAC7_9BILA|nr:hypothetical protein Y032_0265g661 [Ancylostoma ceylanicum]
MGARTRFSSSNSSVSKPKLGVAFPPLLPSFPRLLLKWSTLMAAHEFRMAAMSELERSHIPRQSCRGSGKNGDIAAFVLLGRVPCDFATSNAARARF